MKKYMELEKKAIESGKSIINTSINKSNYDTLDKLLKNNYEIISVENNEYILKKNLMANKSFRISLTENCNYQCFFCHEEGVDMVNQRESEKTEEEVYNQCKKMIEAGFSDLTFTGGEPLLKKEWIKRFILKFEKESLFPDITIVTNGVLIDDELLNIVEKYSGKFKFNFSMHHIKKEKYLKIVIPKDKKNSNYDKVIENIEKITKRGLDIKLNFVILNGLNNSVKDLEDIINFSEEKGVKTIKFLEFLVTDKLIDQYQHYFKLEELEKRLSENLIFKSQNERTKYFNYRAKNIVIELSHCHCAVGCSKCLLTTDYTLTSDFKFFPCFFRSGVKPIDVTKNSIPETLEKRNKILNAFSLKYGDKTPFKVDTPNFIKGKKNYNYISKLSVDNLEKLLESKNYEFFRVQILDEILYKQDGDIFIKLYKNTYENDYTEVVKKVVIKDGVANQTFIFGTEKRMVKIEGLDAYNDYVETLGSEKLLEIKWEIKFYRNKDALISFSKNNLGEEIFIVANDLLEKEFMAVLLEIPVEKKVVELYKKIK